MIHILNVKSKDELSLLQLDRRLASLGVGEGA
jgi:hypothetical protein